MKSITENLNDLNQLILSGKALEAFEKYYDDQIVMQENNNPPTIGKEANRKREIDFFNSITDFRGADVLGMAAEGNLSFVIWQYDYTHKEWGEKKYTQVAVQHWNNGKIVKEQFFYNN